MKNRNSLIHSIVFVLFLFLLVSYQKDKMFFVEQEVVLNYFNYIVSPVLICIIGLVYLILYRSKLPKSVAFHSISTFVLYITICSLCYSFFSPIKAKAIYFYILMLYLLLCYVSLVYRMISEKLFVSGVIFLFSAFVIVYISGYKEQIINQLIGASNASYTILYVLPLLLCIKNKTINIISLLLTLLVVLTSLKRGGVVAYIVGILLYFYTSQVVLSRRKMKLISVIGFVFVLVGTFYIMSYVNTSIGGVLAERFSSISDDGGSGRLEIWGSVINLITHSSLFGLLFGHGWDAVYREIGTSAHNDFLEVFYDFGILGLIIFISLLYRLLGFTKSLLKRRSVYAPVMTLSLAIFFINSMVSHIVVYPHYFILFLMCWSYIIVNSSYS